MNIQGKFSRQPVGMPQPSSDRPMTVIQLARQVGRSKSTILNWIKCGRLKATNLASDTATSKARWVILESDWKAFKSSHAKTGRPLTNAGLDRLPDLPYWGIGIE